VPKQKKRYLKPGLHVQGKLQISQQQPQQQSAAALHSNLESPAGCYASSHAAADGFQTGVTNQYAC
jgi:hypothetical protein